MNRLFAYGTLRDPEYQQALFGYRLTTQPATLPDWAAVMGENGYLTLIHAPGEAVSGELLDLDDDALALADAWEDVDYERLQLEARDAGGSPLTAFVYVRPTALRERAPAGTFAQHPREHVLAAIARARADYVRTKSESA
jgi:gamma-glutamylcyclotransferase (GGCT)/AIG2-like uncharacterized protein YtfP